MCCVAVVILPIAMAKGVIAKVLTVVARVHDVLFLSYRLFIWPKLVARV